jgi:hypothetical protein
MSDQLRRYGNEVWDRFFDFIAPCNENLTQQEVRAELQRRGIDVRPVVARVQQALESRRARESLAAAKLKRATVEQRVRGVVAPPGESLRASLDQHVARLSEPYQAAYFHKLSKAQTDADLQSLLEDLHRLEALEEDDDGGTDGE